MDVIVVGAGVSGLTAAFVLEREAAARARDVHVRVLEREGRSGGKIDTRHVGGFVVEEAAAGWLSTSPAPSELCRSLGLEGALVTASEAAKRRYLLTRGRLHEIAPGPRMLLSDVLSPLGRARLMLEPFARAAPGDDESVADFARRHIGREGLDALVDPMVSGIFAGDPERLSLASAFPRMAALEREHGSLIRAMRAIMRERRRSGGPAPFGATLTSLRGGMSELVSALRDALSVPPIVGSGVVRLERRPGGWRVLRREGPALDAEKVVLATPADVTAALLAEHDAEVSRELEAIPHAPVAVVALGWRREDLPALPEGFGFLVPHREGREILGSLWESQVFEGRAPAGAVLTRTMLGGARRGALVQRSEADLVQLVREELHAVLGVSAPPQMIHVKRHARAIPQYVVGHAARLARIEERLARLPGLVLAGSSYRGVSVGDCVSNAAAVARGIIGE